MPGTPDNTVILHWDECGTTWAKLSWHDWARFRGFGKDGLSILAGAEAGEHYFLVCVLGDRGELANVIPHKYVLSTDGRLCTGSMGWNRENAKNITGFKCCRCQRSRTRSVTM